MTALVTLIVSYKKGNMNKLIIIPCIPVLSLFIACDVSIDDSQASISYDEYEQNTGIPLDTLRRPVKDSTSPV